MSYVEISLEEMDEVLSEEKGWERGNGNGRAREFIYEWSYDAHPVKIVVFSSIHVVTHVSRGCGRDAIRVCAVNYETKKGILKSTRIKRTPGWDVRLRDAVVDVLNRAVLRLADAEERKEKSKIELDDSFDEVRALFDVGKSKLKYPKVRFVMEDDSELCLALAGDRARHPGSINVTDGKKFGENIWYGRVHLDGKFEPSRNCTDEIIDFLKKFSEDPVSFAAEYGKRTGNCCFCHKPLKDDRSRHFGYGPVCAKKWELPWSTKEMREDDDPGDEESLIEMLLR